MNIPRVTLVFSITILQLSVDFICAACPQYQVPHTVDSTTVCCKPVFNCTKDHEIVFCLQDGGTDKCIPCDGEAINPFVTSSVDMKRRVCFNQTESHKDCPMQDTFPIPEHEFCKHMLCSCNTEDCRYGDPCGICEKGTPCGVNEQMNAKTGACEPCGDLMNSPAGCGPCIYNETAWRINSIGGSDRSVEEVMKKWKDLKVPRKHMQPSTSETIVQVEGEETAVIHPSAIHVQVESRKDVVDEGRESKKRKRSLTELEKAQLNFYEENTAICRSQRKVAEQQVKTLAVQEEFFRLATKTLAEKNYLSGILDPFTEQ